MFSLHIRNLVLAIGETAIVASTFMTTIATAAPITAQPSGTATVAAKPRIDASSRRHESGRIDVVLHILASLAVLGEGACPSWRRC
jgi:hypothetical protein